MCLLIPVVVLVVLIGAAFVLAPLRERLSLRAFAGDDQFVVVQDYAIHYTDDGPRAAPPVVLLHGFGAWSFTWRIQREVLLRAGYRVIATDQIGYGASARPTGPIYTTKLQAQLTLGVLDALGVREAHFVGHSYGGRVALQIALDAPERVRSLAVISPEAFATTRPPIARLAALPVVGFTLAVYSSFPQLVRPGLKYVSKRDEWLTDEVVAGYAAPTRVRGTAAAQVWQARSPKDGARSVPEHLAEVQARTLIVWGSDDPVFPASDAQKLATILPNAQLLIVQGVGHLPHEEKPDEVNAALLAFLSG